MRCGTCNSADVTVVAFTSGDGATYRYCRYCETGRWETDGHAVATSDILRVASRIEPAQRTAAA